VAGCIRDDELALGGGKVSVGHIDRDALLALSPEPIRQQGEVDMFVSTLPGGIFHCRQLVFKNIFGVVKEPPDEGAFSVVNASGSGEAQKVHV